MKQKTNIANIILFTLILTLMAPGVALADLMPPDSEVTQLQLLSEPLPPELVGDLTPSIPGGQSPPPGQSGGIPSPPPPPPPPSQEYTFNVSQPITIAPGSGGYDGMIAITRGTGGGSVTSYVYAQDNIILTGTSTTSGIVVDGVTAKITLQHVVIERTEPALELKNGATASLSLVGQNILSSNYDRGIHLPTGTTIVMGGNGSLHTAGYVLGMGSFGTPPGIGGGGEIRMNSGQVTATGGNATGDGSVAGVGIQGNITMNGGHLTATGGNATGDWSVAGVGIQGNITMNGGHLTATGGSVQGDNSSAEVGIYGNVTVNSGIMAATGGSATGHNSEAGVGIFEVDTITISGGTVTATGGDSRGSSSRAGLGIYGNTIHLDGGSITATGGSAQGVNSSDGAGIGNILLWGNSTIVIDNQPQVVATGGGNAAPVGMRPGATGTLTLQDTSGNNLTYLRLEMKTGSTPLANTSLTIFATGDSNGITGTTNADGVVGFFVPRTPETDYTLSINSGNTLAVIQPGDQLTRSYTLNMANEAVLTGLSLTTAEENPAPVTLTPAFQGSQRHYTAQVNHHQASLHLYPTAPAAATITLHHTTGAWTSPFQHIPLQEGTNDLTIRSQAIDTDEEVIYLEHYTLSVHRGAPLSGNAALGTLSLNKGNLTPAFAKDHYQYTATVAHATDTLVIQATTEDPKATLTGIGTKNLQVGTNSFEVTVRAENGSEQVYHMTVTRRSASSGGSGRNNDSNTTNTTPPIDNPSPPAATNTGDTPPGETQGTDGTTGQRPPVTIRLTIGQRESQVNGTPTSLEAAPYIDPVSQRTMMPLRFISEALGANVTWKAETRQVIITSGDTEIILTIGSTEALVNGIPMTLEAPPVIQPPGRTFVPLRFISEALGVEVTWHPETQSITLTR